MKKSFALLGLLLLLATGNAHAGDGGDCGGNLIEYKPIMANGKKIGQLQLYYNANTQKNCAVTVHGGESWGERSYTNVTLLHCYRSPNEDPTCHYARVLDDQTGQFRYQAGPIRVDGDKICISAYGQIRFKGTDYSAYTKPHCD